MSSSTRVPQDDYVGTNYLGEEEIDEVTEVLRAKSLFRYEGPRLLNKTLEFERGLRRFLGADNVLAVSNGHSALKMALRGLGIGPGDEVLVPAFTFVSTASSVLEAGALPRFAEVDETLNIDPQSIEPLITERTRAIAVVHMRGVPCDMSPIMSLAKKHGLCVIEDCAQSFGAKYRGQHVGTFGDAAAYSFHANKIITTGEGGAFTAKDATVFSRARMYHDQGGVRIGSAIPSWTDPEALWGENYKITEVQSAIGIAQLRKAPRIVGHQQQVYQQLVSELRPEFRLRPVPAGAEPVPFTLCLQFPTAQACEEFVQRAQQSQLEARRMVGWFLPDHNAFRHRRSWHRTWNPLRDPSFRLDECPVTKGLLSRSAWIPLSPLLRPKHIGLVAEILNSIV